MKDLKIQVRAIDDLLNADEVSAKLIELEERFHTNVCRLTDSKINSVF